MQRRNRRAKIVATVGPASASPTMLRRLFLAGVDVFRLNFSHGVHEDHAAVHKAIRDLEADVGRPIGILQDLQGPKIRVGTLKDGAIVVKTGETVRFVPAGSDGDAQSIPLPHPEIFAAALPGHRLLIDDGRLQLKVKSFDSDAIVADVIVGGKISNRKGVNVPDTVLDLSPLTDKDRVDLEFGHGLGRIAIVVPGVDHRPPGTHLGDQRISQVQPGPLEPAFPGSAVARVFCERSAVS